MAGAEGSPWLFAFGILAALASAILYSAGVTLQAIEAREAPQDEGLRPALLRDLAGRRRWQIGTACVVGGWTMQAVALLTAPITIVQPALAVSVVSLLVISKRFFGEAIRRQDAAAAAAIVVGVAGLVLVAPAEGSDNAAPVTLAIGMVALGAAALAPYLMHGHHKFGEIVVFSAGLAYAWTGFSTSFLADGVSDGAWIVATLWLAATAGAALVGLLSEMTALQRQSAVRVFPVVLIVQIVMAVLLAPLLAGESLDPSVLMVVTLAVSLAVVTAGTFVLARSPAVETAIADCEDPVEETLEPAETHPSAAG